ncbi:MAG: hypothetical protein QOD57_5435 [Actinomycetota bacterium]|jgi:hypothetical protein|nr:hypothetical protein [Actinomycetota bacterium]MDQ1496932.1 hypothetical protein [Actinomycetota bacterium]MDQ1507708.1 hypothetical protein [Actinomycetota bacterium]
MMTFKKTCRRLAVGSAIASFAMVGSVTGFGIGAADAATTFGPPAPPAPVPSPPMPNPDPKQIPIPVPIPGGGG